ncbi:MAG: 2-oxoglutarate dehydrogenase E1 component [Rickettsiales bacterium]|nr:2-oxoglutarate dehydrogenase E1 component [Rickettsiales bacterium]
MVGSFEITSPFFGGNGAYIEELFERYLTNPASVDESWRQLFQEATGGASASARKASWTKITTRVIGAEEPKDEKPAASKDKKAAPAISQEQIEKFAHDSIRAIMMVRAYRVRGHLIANLDPLGLEVNAYHPELDPATYGFSDKDMDREIFLDGSLGIKKAKLREIVAILRQTYCANIGVEFMHIQHPDQKAWIQKRFEQDRGDFRLSTEDKKYTWNTLVEVESFEQFLQLKYPSTKRFSVQGGDAMLPGLEAIIHTASKLGVKEIAIGMPHRGRMNVLTTVLGKPYVELLSIFQGNVDFPEWVPTSGDVKYHLGTSVDRETPYGKIHLSLLANPSHLEAVDPVVVGKVRAKLDILGDPEENGSVMGVMMHGDAAFAGQGVVAETLALSELRGYRTGGSIHIIVNNQIGFTTSPKYSRFTPYPTDVAKSVQAPIFHVNGDDPEAVVYVCKLAAEFRQMFKRDAVVDIFCYRKYGHNESDEPMFTQPLMYREISKKPLPADIYSQKLINDGVLTQPDVDAKFAEFRQFFEKEFEAAKSFKPNKADWLEGNWAGLEKAKGEHPDGDTGVELDRLKQVGLAISKVPAIKINSKIVRQLEAKRKMIDEGQGIDWATAEALAFGTLLSEGHRVRLSGQDCGRGTFSHRHSVLVDQETEERYLPLNNIAEGQKPYEVIDSSLSEFAILGYEYGYSIGNPKALTLWEAQFGDFANGAQVIIDQFISSGEVKWLRMSGLVMLLPHGYEGQGPEHSSARLERYLQLCGEDNMQVANCTTPANYFHILRRQQKRNFRKPLVIMTPKSLLRHKLAVSALADMAKDTHFKRVIGETQQLVKDDKIRRVVITSGKVYYELFEARAAQNINDVAIIRTEQYYPFPEREIKAELSRYKNAEIVWCQEEPKNMGAWSFISPRIEDVMEAIGRTDRLRYTGRPEAASPAAGYLKIHEKEQKLLVSQAIDADSVLQKKAAKA